MADAGTDIETLRAEWRGAIADISDRIRRIDRNHRIDMLRQESGEAARHWRLMLVGWRDELMDVLRHHPMPDAAPRADRAQAPAVARVREIA